MSKCFILDFIYRCTFEYQFILSESIASFEWTEMITQQGDKVWNKYASKYSDYELKMRVKQALYQKGFPIEKIEMYIEQKEQDNG